MTIDYAVGGVEALDDAMLVMGRAFDPRFGEAWSAAQCSGILAMPGATLILATGDTGPIGFALLRTIAGEAELMLIAVRPEARGHGVGSGLLEQVTMLARADGAQRLFLEVRSDNDAITIYEKAGFCRVGQRQNYYRGNDGQVRDALTFRRILD